MEKEMTKTTVSSKRMLWADIIRIVAIYLVIQLHTSVPVYSQLPWDLFIKMTIVSVPLFVMLSGALLMEKQENYITFFRKRCAKVLIPWVIWTIIYMFYFLYYYQSEDTYLRFFSDGKPIIVQWFQYFVVMFLSNLWFLALIFSLYIFMPLLRVFVKNAKKNDVFYFLILWYLFISVIPFLYRNPLFPQWEPNMIFSAIQYFGYLILGYLLAKKKFIKDKKIIIVLFLTISILPIIIPSDYLYGFLNPVAVISSAAVFFLLFNVSNKLDKYVNKTTRDVIAKISSASLGIYIIHKIISDLLSVNLIIFLQKFHGEFLLTFIIFIISACVVLVVKRVPIAKYIVP
jgi:surface polysaccharide O-acyltransferase-like enzyme